MLYSLVLNHLSMENIVVALIVELSDVNVVVVHCAITNAQMLRNVCMYDMYRYKSGASGRVTGIGECGGAWAFLAAALDLDSGLGLRVDVQRVTVSPQRHNSRHCWSLCFLRLPGVDLRQQQRTNVVDVFRPDVAAWQQCIEVRVPDGVLLVRGRRRWRLTPRDGRFQGVPDVFVVQKRDARTSERSTVLRNFRDRDGLGRPLDSASLCGSGSSRGSRSGSRIGIGRGIRRGIRRRTGDGVSLVDIGVKAPRIRLKQLSNQYITPVCLMNV